MSSAKNKKRWLVAMLAATSISGSVAFSDSPQPLQRIGRFVGAGWGDGYHACESSGFRPTANLPPRSYYQQFESPKCRSNAGCSPSRAQANAIEALYGPLASCNSDGCDTSNRESGGCDSTYLFELLNTPAIMQNDSSMHDSTTTESMTNDSQEAVNPGSPSAPSATVDQTPAIIQGRIEELPATQPNATPPAAKQPKRLSPIQTSPSDKPSKLDSSSLAPHANTLAVDLHESQMRPIRPLPPQPKRELSYPERPQSPQDSSELTLPRPVPTAEFPKSIQLPPSISAKMPYEMSALNHASVQENPFFGKETQDSDAGLRPERLGPRKTEASTAEASDRVAEVPDWLIVKQPR